MKCWLYTALRTARNSPAARSRHPPFRTASNTRLQNGTSISAVPVSDATLMVANSGTPSGMQA